MDRWPALTDFDGELEASLVLPVTAYLLKSKADDLAAIWPDVDDVAGLYDLMPPCARV